MDVNNIGYSGEQPQKKRAQDERGARNDNCGAGSFPLLAKLVERLDCFITSNYSRGMIKFIFPTTLRTLLTS